MSTLSGYFKGVGIKRLVKGELPFNREKGRLSTQHEFNGSRLVPLMGKDRLENIPAMFIFFKEDVETTVIERNTVTWYDAREKQNHRSPEYRLYYSASNTTVPLANEDDLLIVGKSLNNTLVIIIAENATTVESQLLWLFGFHEVNDKFQVRDLTDEKQQLGFAGKYILSSLGIELPEKELDFADILQKKFGDVFPTTSAFSEFARATIADTSVIEEPDEALISFMQREEDLFRILEKKIVEKKLREGFGSNGNDVDDFISFSLSVQNRRKSRAGFAFENHLAFIFTENHLRFAKGKKTERNNKPDLLFPGIKEYHEPSFNVELLTMLGVKTSAKDRWRQVLSEADRISEKHLITLEPRISPNQTEEMRAKLVQLVVPEEIKSSYTPAQQSSIMDLKSFIELVQDRQSRASIA
jgi:hypothetical protein